MLKAGGAGSTVTSMLNGVPVHSFNVGVTIYLTIPLVPAPEGGVVKVGLIRICSIMLPHEEVHAEKPVIFAPESREACQVNVAPGINASRSI